jgi:Cu/Ag efflux protein CusF
MRRRLLLLLPFGAACARKSGPPKDDHRFPLTGSVVRLDREKRIATIQHDDIRDAEGQMWMAAMTMDFPVLDVREFEKLQEGGKIRATVHQRESDMLYWIAEIEAQP